MKLNASQAERWHGTPRCTVGRWIKTGRLHADAAGYFEESDLLALDAERTKRPAPGRAGRKKRKLKASNEKAKDEVIINRTVNQRASDSRQEVELRKASAQADKVELEVRAKLNDLISREVVAKVFRKLYSIDATEWRGLGPSIAPDIMSICKIEDQAVELEISAVIEEAVFMRLSSVKRVMNDFLEEVDSEQLIE